jgi:uncharacterized protein YjiS (DUF1127 family)
MGGVFSCYASAPPERFVRLFGSIRNDPEHWRERAEEARHLAEQMSDPEAREVMLRIAADYEQLAENAQRRATLGDRKL